MSDWIVDDKIAQVNITTAANNERLFTGKEVRRAQEAKKFIANSGYPSEKEAVRLVSDGNITGVKLTASDIHRAYRIYGNPPASVRGKTTKSQVERQEVDIALIAVAEPLQLTLASPVKKEHTEELAQALQTQINTLGARGFKVVRVHADPQRSLAALAGLHFGVEVDITGAGDHHGNCQHHVWTT